MTTESAEAMAWGVTLGIFITILFLWLAQWLAKDPIAKEEKEANDQERPMREFRGMPPDKSTDDEKICWGPRPPTS